MSGELLALAERLEDYRRYIRDWCKRSHKPGVTFGRATMRDLADLLEDVVAALRAVEKG